MAQGARELIRKVPEETTAWPVPCVSRNLVLAQREGGAGQPETGHKEPHVEALPTDQRPDDGDWNEGRW